MGNELRGDASLRTEDVGPRAAVALVRPIAHGLTRFGVLPEEFLAAVGAESGAPDEMVSIVRLAAVVDGIADRTRTPHLGLELARMMPLGCLGASDYCFSTSATLLDALVRIASHVGMFTEALRYDLFVDGDTARIEERHLFRPLRVLTELSSAFVVRRLRDVLGEGTLRLTAVRFGHALRGSIAPYSRYFGVPVAFGAGADDIAFPRALLKAPLLTADPVLASMLCGHPRVRVAPTQHGVLLERARSIVDQSLHGRKGVPVVGVVARRLALSSRSFQRKLHEAGMPYSRLVDDARRDLATALLARDGTLLVDVAHHLGFTSLAAFFRAFRRWTGLSPRAFAAARRRS